VQPPNKNILRHEAAHATLACRLGAVVCDVWHWGCWIDADGLTTNDIVAITAAGLLAERNLSYIPSEMWRDVMEIYDRMTVHEPLEGAKDDLLRLAGLVDEIGEKAMYEAIEAAYKMLIDNWTDILTMAFDLETAPKEPWSELAWETYAQKFSTQQKRSSPWTVLLSTVRRKIRSAQSRIYGLRH
jgi:hypothetical protein